MSAATIEEQLQTLARSYNLAIAGMLARIEALEGARQPAPAPAPRQVKPIVGADAPSAPEGTKS